MARNIIEKIWERHVIAEQEGHPAVLGIDLLLLHEVTSAQAFQMLEERNLTPFAPDMCVATLDHSIPTRPDRFNIIDPEARIQVETLRSNCSRYNIRLYDFESGYQGIVHVIGPELGLTRPGMTIVCGDSHTATHGAFGALAFGIGSTEVGHVLASGALLQRMPRTIKVNFKGELKEGVFSKDVVLELIRQIGTAGANGHVIEYCGEAVRRMSMEERMTICNMSIECGARAGLISPDEITIEYLRTRRYSPRGKEFESAVENWLAYASDPDACYDREITIDLTSLEPLVTWGTNPAQAAPVSKKVPDFSEYVGGGSSADFQAALNYTGLKPGDALEGVPVERAFVGSCTNGRIEDLRIVANILRGRRVKEGVKFYIVPGSERVRSQAIEEGLDKIFKEAGADFRMPGCSMCLAMNDDVVPAGQRCISSSNRNFVGRQGPGSITHLASPATVAASAVKGCITDCREYL
ncbi:MAG: 3-isopropylmalate dehydratase large subunit [Candidatus Dadabacteria bacterium]|nr:MAG: 3-isopropylmalate dehydratase large subunit [Candidatus Dadabacteria bacterium]